jgi:hypothetical protein
VGDYNSSVPAHQAIPLALDLASAHQGTRIHATWIPTATIHKTQLDLESYQGIWCVPASPIPKHAGSITTLKYLAFATGAIKAIGVLPEPVRAQAGLAVSPDEHWLLYGKSRLEGSQLMLVEGFR